MNFLTGALRQTVAGLNRYRRKWALIGGLAVSARAEPRFTRDIEFFGVGVAVDCVRSLLSDGYALLASIEQDSTKRLATVRLQHGVTAEDEVIVDLLFASSGIEPEIADAAEGVEIVPGLIIPVAAAGHLIALKLLADAEHRPQDRADLIALSAVATPEDLTVARDAVHLITERGYNRDRNLLTAMDDLVKRDLTA